MGRLTKKQAEFYSAIVAERDALRAELAAMTAARESDFRQAMANGLKLSEVRAELEARKLDGEQMRLYMELHSQAMLTLIVAMKEPVSDTLAESLGNLSLRCRALHEHKTKRIATIAEIKS